MKIIIILLIMFIEIPSADAGEGNLFLRLTHMDYHRARSILILQGVVPVPIERHTNFLDCWGDVACNKYDEGLRCSGTGLAFCDFVYFDRKKQKYVILTTYGETRHRIYSLSYATPEDLEGWSPRRRDGSRR